MVTNIELGGYYRATLTFRVVATQIVAEPTSFRIELQREIDEALITIESTEPPTFPTGTLIQTSSGIWEFSYKMTSDKWWRLRIEATYSDDFVPIQERFYVEPDPIEGAVPALGSGFSDGFSDGFG